MTKKHYTNSGFRNFRPPKHKKHKNVELVQGPVLERMLHFYSVCLAPKALKKDKNAFCDTSSVLSSLLAENAQKHFEQSGLRDSPDVDC